MKQTQIFCMLVICMISTLTISWSQIPAFPGAEGFGANTPGGRGGKIIYVTNLNDSGSGSFRAACEASGPRTVLFKVGGTITLESTVRIEDPYITIAGQSAPGGGICIKGNGNGNTPISLRTHDIILRYLRIRPGPGGENDGLTIQTEEAHDIIIDHCSITWGVDESASLYTGDVNKKIRNITYQWNIISDALHCSTHSEGCHSKGLLLQYCDKISVHHNLFANNGARSPLILSGEMDLRNNVIYNWEGSPVKVENRHGDVFMNFIKNYIAPGEDSDLKENGVQIKTEGVNLFLKDNIAEHVRPDNSYPEDAIVNYREPATLVSSVYNYPFVTTTSATQAYDDVLENVGANCPERDSADKGTIKGVRDRTGRLINHPSDVGGYPNLAKGTAPEDSDADGMPDEWEIVQGLNPNNADDGPSDRDSDGYTNVEEYLNGIILDNRDDVSHDALQPLTGLIPANITSSENYSLDFVECNVMDSNLNTRWSANGNGQWLTFDLGSTKSFNTISVAYFKGDQRTTNFDIQVSDDGTSWTNIITNIDSNGTTLDLESFSFPIQNKRYLRYLGHGNSTNQWNSLTEFTISTTIAEITSNYWRLENKSSNQWIRTKDCSGSTLDIIPLVQTSNTNTGFCTMFEFIPADDGYYFIQNKATKGRYRPKDCSAITNDSVEIVQVSENSLGLCKQWKLVETDEEGYFRIENRQTGGWIRVQECSDLTDDSIPITQVSQNYSGDCTKWKLVVAESKTKNNDLNQQILDDTILLHPNPANDVLTITSNAAEEIQYIKIYDIQGSVVKEISTNLLTEEAIDVSDMTDGLYIISFDFIKKPTRSSKLIIKH